MEVVDNALARIEETAGALNCFAFVFPEEARAAAREAEAAFAAGRDVGPLAGVPIAIKDLTPTAGKRTTLGSYAYEHWVPEHSSVIVERLLGAGGIMVGKTTTPEFAYSTLHGVAALGHHPQPVGHVPVARGLVGRLRRGRRVGLRAAGGGHRHGRVGAHPGLLERRGRPQADGRPHPARHPAVALRQHRPLRPAGPHDRRRAPVPVRGAGRRRPRRHVAARPRPLASARPPGRGPAAGPRRRPGGLRDRPGGGARGARGRRRAARTPARR